MKNLKSFKSYINEESGSLKSRIMSKISKQKNGCWIWKAHTGTDGFSQISVGGIAKNAHRVLYKLMKGGVSPSQVLRHKCNNRKCLNPAHLTPGTKHENNMDTKKAGHVRNQYTGPMSNTPRGKGLRPKDSH
jgi:hypothetical protein